MEEETAIAALHPGDSGKSPPPAPNAGAKHRLAQLANRLRRRTRIDMRLRYLAWRVKHPMGNYGEFYSYVIADRLERGVPHRTLGTKLWDSEDGDRSTPGFATQDFAEKGQDLIADLESFGLRKDSVCVDFGCGSLRVGQHLMRMLPPEHYWGLDITDRFFREALMTLPPDLVANSRPHLHAIDEQILAVLERQPPDFLFSYAVLKHVPPRELDLHFDGFMRLVGPRTVAVIYFADASSGTRTGPMSWAYPAELLVAKILARRPLASVGIVRIGAGNPGSFRHSRSVLWITGPEVNARMPVGLAIGASATPASGASGRATH